MDLKILNDTPPWDWPRDAGRIIRKALTDRRAGESERLLAAEMAGELVVMNEEMAPALLGVVLSADEPERLRARAAISFGPILEDADTEGFEDSDAVPIRERTFRNIQDSLQKLYFEPGTPKEVRRRILEASVRAPQDWHQDAVRTAYLSGDRDWLLTAVFAMQWVPGFDDQILVALKSADPEVHVEAVNAAGERELEAAWPHVAALVQDRHTPKPLLLAAIAAAGSIRPKEAAEFLAELSDSDDEEIAEAVDETLSMAEAVSGIDEEDEDGDEWIN